MIYKVTCILILLSLSVYGESHRPQDFLNEIKGSKLEGELIVQQFCMNCHDVKPLISLGAPRIGVNVDWEPRIKKGIEQMLQNTTEGYNAMPPRGGCFECTDEQLNLAIIAMFPELLKKKLRLELNL